MIKNGSFDRSKLIDQQKKAQVNQLNVKLQKSTTFFVYILFSSVKSKLLFPTSDNKIINVTTTRVWA